MTKTKDVHILMDEETLADLKSICLYKGQMTYFIKTAIKQFVVAERKRREEEGKKEEETTL